MDKTSLKTETHSALAEGFLSFRDNNFTNMEINPK